MVNILSCEVECNRCFMNCPLRCRDSNGLDLLLIQTCYITAIQSTKSMIPVKFIIQEVPSLLAELLLRQVTFGVSIKALTVPIRPTEKYCEIEKMTKKYLFVYTCWRHTEVSKVFSRIKSSTKCIYTRSKCNITIQLLTFASEAY